MKFRNIGLSTVVCVLFLAGALPQEARSQGAPTNAASTTEAIVPRLMKFSGALLDAKNTPMPGPVGVTFALYAQESGGAALWMETQNVHPDANGNYTVLLGAASKDGLPAEQFTTGEARWLGVQVENRAENSRILLVSVPYALKAHDAETLGGLPASAFLPAKQGAVSSGAASSSATVKGTNSSAGPLAPVTCPFAGAGTLNFIPIWTGACSQANSLLFQTGGNVGLSTTTPKAKLDVEAPATDATGIFGGTPSTAFFAAGVWGNATGATGVTRGVYGTSSSPTGIGVHGIGATGGQFETGSATGNILVGRGLGFTRFIISPTGLVGIGTTSPAAMLDVNAPNVINSPVARFGSSVGGSSNSILVFNKFCAFPACLPTGLTTGTSEVFLSGGPNTYIPGTIGGDGGIRVIPSRNIFFGDSGHSRMVIASNGNVGISPFGSAPQATLDVIGATNNTIPVGRFFAELNQNILVGLANIEGAVTVFRVDSSGKVFADGGFQTGGADFAESFAVRGERNQYEAGDLLMIDRSGSRRMALAQDPYSKLVAGIYSTKPGLLGTPHAMSDPEIEREVPLAVVGVVPCKVTVENGSIATGDLLVSSSTPGYAMKGTNRKRMLGAVVGKALEPLSNGKGTILVLVTLQ